MHKNISKLLTLAFVSALIFATPSLAHKNEKEKEQYFVMTATIQDMNAWRKMFDEDRHNRKKAGYEDLYVLSDVENPNELVMVFKVKEKNLEKAKAFLNKPDMAEKMKKATVTKSEGKFKHKVLCPKCMKK